MAGGEISVWSLVIGASILVKGVLMILLLASIWSWAMIFKKRTLLKSTRSASARFTQDFWSGTELLALYRTLKGELQGTALLFQCGFRAFLKCQDARLTTAQIMEQVERAMRVGFSREHDKLESHLPILATIGSVSPYVGLFGTVWGIMSAFIALGGVQQATLSMVAPGIAEALIATAMGLFAAIPAVVAYNRFLSLIESELNEYENFQDEFINLLSRQLTAKVD